MKFKVGDIVKIKEGLTSENTRGFVSNMEKYCGKKAKITKISGMDYNLDIDEGEWYWYEDMLEDVRPKKYEITVEGNTVTVTDDEGNTGVAKCSPEDEFNLSTGISLAIDRLTWKPNQNENYWSIDFSQPDYVRKYQWVNDSVDNGFFKNGVIFKTKKEAVETAKKMLEVL